MAGFYSYVVEVRGGRFGVPLELHGRVSRLVQRDIAMTMLHCAYLFRPLR